MNCKFCGAPISANDKFCPFCGSKINTTNDNVIVNNSQTNNEINTQNISPNSSNVVASSNANVFSSSKWKELWSSYRDTNSGIILIRTDELKDKKTFINELNLYIEYKKTKGVNYCYLDLANQKVKGANYCYLDLADQKVKGTDLNIIRVLALLNIIYSVNVPNYLLIIGDDNVIPKRIYENPLWNKKKPLDEDRYVFSDLAYLTLTMDSPWVGKKFNFKNITKVGRIPASVGNNFGEAIIYFNNAKKFVLKEKTNNFVMTYQPKKIETSMNAFDFLKPYYFVSPLYVSKQNSKYPSAKMLPKLTGYDILDFALHGSSTTHSYYGENEGNYPEAFDYRYLPENSNGYFIMSQACYGAKSKINVTSRDSILLNALQKNCMAFIGSTMISYSGRYGNVSASDVLAKEILRSITAGDTFGEAFLNGLDSLNGEKNDEVTIKLLAEYGLYGDPSTAFVVSNKKAFDIPNAKMCEASDGNTFEFIEIDENAGFGDETDNMKLVSFGAKSNSNIKDVAYTLKDISKKIINNNFKDFKDEEPLLYKLNGKDEYRSVYSKLINDVNKVVRISFDNNGDVIGVYESD